MANSYNVLNNMLVGYMGLLNTLSIPKDVQENSFVITLIGQREAHVGNFINILEYNDSLVRIRVNRGYVEVTGKHLLIDHMYTERLVIRGYINSVRSERT